MQAVLHFCFFFVFECLIPRSAFSFQSRKYGDKFAEKLSTILPEFKMLKKLE